MFVISFGLDNVGIVFFNILVEVSRIDFVIIKESIPDFMIALKFIFLRSFYGIKTVDF